jgi:hypothetical protein
VLGLPAETPARAIQGDAAKNWQSLPDDVKRWLDADMDGSGSRR